MRKAIFVWGGWEGHEPRQCTEIVAEILSREDFDCEIVEGLSPYDDIDRLCAAHLIVQCVTMGTIAPEQEKNLLEAVRSGVGLAGWHGGLCDAFRNNPGYQFMTGGQWVAHPGNDKIDYTVRAVKDDPIINGIGDIALCSEQYYLLMDPACEVLAETEFSGDHEGIDWIRGVRMPMIWKKRWGRGKVFYSALGHVADEFRRYPQLTEVMRRGMLWAAKS